MKIKNTIRVILADDHAMIRRGIRRLLEKDSNICVIGEAGTGAEALRLVRELEPDLILLDMEMPDMKGIHVARELRAHHVPVSIVILSACDDEYFIQEILQVGVDGYLNKSESLTKIRDTVHQAAQTYNFRLRWHSPGKQDAALTRPNYRFRFGNDFHNHLNES
jgi:two-component system nitrate/nitrite response regulator NarL